MTAPELPNPGRDVEPEAEGTPAREAGELVVQGLLEYMHRGDAASREDRIATFLDSLNADTRVFPFRRAVKWGLGVAALIALTTALVMMGSPGGSTAQAEVQQSISAMRTAGDRRYEVTLDNGEVNAIIDTRGPGLLLIRHKPPWARGFIAAGRDAKGAWATKRDGGVTRDQPERFWPPFVTDGGESLIMDSMDRLLQGLPDKFELTRADAAGIPGATPGARTFDRVTARRRSTAGPQPNVVELWIDPATHLVERIEYHWTGVGGGPGGPGDRGREGGSHGPPPDGDRGPGGPDHDHGHGPHGHGPDDFGPGDHDHGPDGHGDRPPPPPPDGDRRGGRLRMIVFQRVDAGAFAADWFSPEGHAGN